MDWPQGLARLEWRRTGYVYFPYAAMVSGQWWVLRFNPDFPAHDMYTVFVDGCARGDCTVESGVFAGAEALDAGLAESVVGAVARYLVYGSEYDDPCVFCADLARRDPMTR